MSTEAGSIEWLASQLKELSSLRPTNKAELMHWYAPAHQIEDGLRCPMGGLSSALPDFFWHYMADADIRMKDSIYADMQNKQLARMLLALQQGRIPSGDELSVEPGHVHV